MTQQTIDIISRIENVKDRELAAKAVEDAIQLIGLKILGRMTELPQPEGELFKRTVITYDDLKKVWKDNKFKWVDDLPF